jgi:hypothetical protein
MDKNAQYEGPMTSWKTNYVRKVDLAIWGCGTDPQVSLKKRDVGDVKRYWVAIQKSPSTHKPTENALGIEHQTKCTKQP